MSPNKTPTEPVILNDVPSDIYHSWALPSSSTLRKIRDCPAQVIYDRNNPKPTPIHFMVGTATDCLLFRGEKVFRERYSIAPAGTDRRKKAYKDWAQSQAGKVILTHDEGSAVTNMVHEIVNHNRAAELLHQCVAEGGTQASIVFRDEGSGLLVKARPDAWGPGFVLDLKTSRAPDPSSFERDSFRYGYGWQLALYQAALAAHGFPCDAAYILAVRSAPVHSVYLYRLSETLLAHGREKYRGALQIWAACEKADYWPASKPDVFDLDLPRWVK